LYFKIYSGVIYKVYFEGLIIQPLRVLGGSLLKTSTWIFTAVKTSNLESLRVYFDLFRSN